MSIFVHMTTILTILLCVSTAMAVLFAIMWIRAGKAEKSAQSRGAEAALAVKESETRLDAAQKALARQAEAAEQRLEDLRKLYETRLEDERRAAEARLADERRAAEARLNDERQATGERFKALASDVLQATSGRLDQQSRMSLEAVLAPLRTSLETFTKDFKDCYSAEQTDRLSLREGIQGLMELNRRVGDETRNLAQALKGNNQWQGRWGEMVLQNILEHSGLEQGRWFVTQETTTDGDDRLRPDAIVNCPHDRKIIIDSKVSLTYYLQAGNADSAEKRDEFAKAHLRSIESHVKCLREKSYQDRIGLRKADFVVMFVPHEGAYISAMNADPDLWQRAFDSRVVIASPTHLVTLIKLVEQMWQTDDQNVNAMRIAEEAGKVIDKLAGFMGDLAKIEDSLDKAHEAYRGAINKLSTGRGNILGRAELIRSLGAKAVKPLPARFTEGSE